MRAAIGILGTLLVLMLSTPPPILASDASGVGAGVPAPLANSSSGNGEVESTTKDGIETRVSRGSAGIQLEGRFAIQAPSEIAWTVLTDYDHIARFVSSMRQSRVTRRTADTIYVEQQAVGRMMLFTRRLETTLRIHETPRTRIEFEDVLASDFKVYRGEWRIEVGPNGTEVLYRLEADPAFSLPDFVARGLFRGAARDLLSQVRSEMERRAALAAR